MSDEPEYIDLITGKPLEPWAADAMKRRATPAEFPALPSREEIERAVKRMEEAAQGFDSSAALTAGFQVQIELIGNDASDHDKNRKWYEQAASDLRKAADALAALHPPASVAEVEGLREAVRRAGANATLRRGEVVLHGSDWLAIQAALAPSGEKG